MKNILIPTDFSLTSISLIKNALNHYDDKRLNVVLVHGYNLTDSITDLLFFSKTREIDAMMSSDFKDGLMILKNHFASRINRIDVELYTGFTKNAFKKMIKARGVTDAFIFQNYQAQKANRNSFDITPLLQKSTDLIQIHTEPWNNADKYNWTIDHLLV